MVEKGLRFKLQMQSVHSLGYKLQVNTSFALKTRVSHIDFTWAGRPRILTSAKVYFATHLGFVFLSVREHDAICDGLTSGQ